MINITSGTSMGRVNCVRRLRVIAVKEYETRNYDPGRTSLSGWLFFFLTGSIVTDPHC